MTKLVLYKSKNRLRSSVCTDSKNLLGELKLETGLKLVNPDTLKISKDATNYSYTGKKGYVERFLCDTKSSFDQQTRIYKTQFFYKRKLLATRYFNRLSFTESWEA